MAKENAANISSKTFLKDFFGYKMKNICISNIIILQVYVNDTNKGYYVSGQF